METLRKWRKLMQIQSNATSLRNPTRIKTALEQKSILTGERRFGILGEGYVVHFNVLRVKGFKRS